MPKEMLYTLKKVWVSGQQLKISRDGDSKDESQQGSKKPAVKFAGGQSKDKKKSKGRDEGTLSLKKRVRKK